MNIYHQQSESTRSKYLFLLVDKVIIALIILFAGFVLNWTLERQKSISDYQKNIFNSRVEVYVALLQQAKIAKDEINIFYGSDSVRSNLEILQDKADEMFRINKWGLGSGSSWTTPYHDDAIEYDLVISSLKKVDSIRRLESLFISNTIAEQVNGFLRVATEDIDTALNFDRPLWNDGKRMYPSEQDSKKVQNFALSARARANRAYLELEKKIRELLRVDGIELG